MLLADFKLSRLVLAIVTVITIADLLPHPNLAPGAIETTFLKVEQLLQPTPEASTAKESSRKETAQQPVPQ